MSDSDAKFGTKFPLPPLQDLLPHAEPMILIEEVLNYGRDFIECRVRAGQKPLPLHAGSLTIPVWVGLEYIAQCIAILEGITAHRENRAIKLGYLLGSRRLDYFTTAFSREQNLLIRAVVSGAAKNIGIFACEIRDALTMAVLLSGTLNTYLP